MMKPAHSDPRLESHSSALLSSLQLPTTTYRFLDIVHVVARSLLGSYGISGQNRLNDLYVLIEKLASAVIDTAEKVMIVEDSATCQVIDRRHHVDQRCVVAGIDHSTVKPEISFAFRLCVLTKPGRFEFFPDRGQTLLVRSCRALRGKAGREGFLLAPVFEIVVKGFAMARIKR